MYSKVDICDHSDSWTNNDSEDVDPAFMASPPLDERSMMKGNHSYTACGGDTFSDNLAHRCPQDANGGCVGHIPLSSRTGNLLGLQGVDDSGISMCNFPKESEAFPDIAGKHCGPVSPELNESSLQPSSHSDTHGKQMSSTTPANSQIKPSINLSLRSCLKKPNNPACVDFPLSLRQNFPSSLTSPSRSVRFNALVAAATYDLNFLDDMEDNKGIIECHIQDMRRDASRSWFAGDTQIDGDIRKSLLVPHHSENLTNAIPDPAPKVQIPLIKHLPPIGLHPFPTVEERSVGMIFVPPSGNYIIEVGDTPFHKPPTQRNERQRRSKGSNPKRTKAMTPNDPFAERLEKELKEALMQLYESHAAKAGTYSLFAEDAGAYIDIYGEHDDWVPVDPDEASINCGGECEEAGVTVESARGDGSTDTAPPGRLSQLTAVFKRISGAMW